MPHPMMPMTLRDFARQIGELVARTAGYLTLQLYAPEGTENPRTASELHAATKQHTEAEVVIFEEQPDGTEKIIGVVKCLPGIKQRIPFGFKFLSHYHIVRANILGPAQQQELADFHIRMSQQAPRKKRYSK